MMKKRKIIPWLVLAGVFCGFLASQIFFDLLGRNAHLTGVEKEIVERHGLEFARLELRTWDKNRLIDLGENAPDLIILNFWASWCHPCLEEFPSLNFLAKKLGPKKAKLIAINLDQINQSEKIAEVLSEKKIDADIDIVAQKSEEYATLFNVHSLPVTLVFYKGSLQQRIEGSFNYSDTIFIESLEKIRLSQ